MQRLGKEGEGEKALQFKSELLRGVFGEGGKRGAELVVGLLERPNGVLVANRFLITSLMDW